MMHHYTIVGCTGFLSSGDMEETVIFSKKDLSPPTVTLTLKEGTQTFHMTLQVTMIQHTKFNCERLSDSEDIVQTNVPRGFERSL